MRLFLLPVSTRRSLIYCQKRTTESSGRLSWWSNPVQKITLKSSETWLGWEKYNKGWRKQVTVYGNKLFQRLPYEEWGLKSIPTLTAKRKREELEGKITSHLEYPGNLLDSEAAQKALQDYGSDARQSFHRKWFWLSCLGAPFTFPFAAIPVIPNLPFFYVAFRAYSHRRAWCGSEHIEFLVKNQLFEKRPSSVLAKAYQVSSLGLEVKSLESDLKSLTAEKASEKPNPTSEKMLLSKSDGVLIADCLGIPELVPEIERAVWQIERSISANEELKEEKEELDSAKERQRGR